MSADKYASICSRQMKIIVYISLRQMEIIVYTVVSTKVVPQQQKRARDNADWCYIIVYLVEVHGA